MKPNTEADPEKQLNKALNVLSYRPRSVAEMRRRGLAAVIPKLIELDLLDDQKFARWWVDQRLRFRPKGNRALTAELLAKGIDREIISQVLLSPEQERQLAIKLRGKYSLSQLRSRGFPIDGLWRKE